MRINFTQQSGSSIESIEKDLERIKSNLKNTQSALQIGAQIVEREIKYNFDRQNWSPLSAKTREARIRKWGYYKQAPTSNAGILIWTGRLKNSVKKKFDSNSVTIYFDNKYAKFHQDGGSKLPVRKLIDIKDGTRKEIIKALQDKIFTKR